MARVENNFNGIVLPDALGATTSTHHTLMVIGSFPVAFFSINFCYQNTFKVVKNTFDLVCIFDNDIIESQKK